ncbi:MAG: ester cyclase [Dysosmobacter welbionis]
MRPWSPSTVWRTCPASSGRAACSARGVDHSLGPGGMVRHLAALRETYPDYTVRILRQHWAAPYVVSECVMEGTHLGPWPGTVPTGKRLIFTGVNIDRVEGGKIVEHGGAVNTFETLWDAGMIRPAE